MIPLGKYVSSCMVLLTLGCWLSLIIGESVHPLFNQKTMFLAVFSSFFIYLLSCVRTVFAAVFSLLWTLYYSTRVIVLFFFPEQLDYSETNTISQNVIDDSMLYVVVSSFTILIGAIFAKRFGCSIFVWQRSKAIHLRRLSSQQTDNISHFSNVSAIGKWSASATLFLFLIKLYSMYIVGTGFTGQTWSSADTIWLRLAYAGNALSIINYTVIVKFFSRIKECKLEILAIVVNFFGTVLLETKKGGVLMHIIMVSICMLVIRKSLPRAALKWIFLAVSISCLFLFESINYLRIVYLDKFSTVAVEQNNAEDRFNPSQSALKFSKRMGGLDWLVGSVLVGNQTLYSGANLHIDLVQSINTFIPGRLVKHPEYFTVPVAKLMPHLLRGMPLDSESGGHGELLALVGSFYVYFGPFGCSVGILFWAYLLSLLELSNISDFMKTFLIYWFGVVVFVGVGFSTGMQMLANLTFVFLPFFVFRRFVR